MNPLIDPCLQDPEQLLMCVGATSALMILACVPTAASLRDGVRDHSLRAFREGSAKRPRSTTCFGPGGLRRVSERSSSTIKRFKY